MSNATTAPPTSQRSINVWTKLSGDKPNQYPVVCASTQMTEAELGTAHDAVNALAALKAFENQSYSTSTAGAHDQESHPSLETFNKYAKELVQTGRCGDSELVWGRSGPGTYHGNDILDAYSSTNRPDGSVFLGTRIPAFYVHPSKDGTCKSYSNMNALGAENQPERLKTLKKIMSISSDGLNPDEY